MEINLQDIHIRSYRQSDRTRLARFANNREIWLNLRDGFPHPYSEKDAKKFIQTALKMNPETMFAIANQDGFIGGIGFSLEKDVERFSAEFGYWLAEPYWGQGIMTRVVKSFIISIFKTFNLNRLYATPYAWNKASAKVLEKAGCSYEGRMKEAAFKDGKFVDKLVYAIIRSEIESPDL